ncbi:alpha/beta hydrolase [Pontibacter qinzhouensis]|uniref:Alpha/beta hydrolase n=1 Tax=Pontibacter qinzhouensis TaxID=2603253 RepID=A0A5C8KB05_9BACT|nr:alpha/beta hydrolase [Pontibacter qinzhouensis]TXK49238.1 alpha/beta hydrolase [Pontibacter qinzhouensis]
MNSQILVLEKETTSIDTTPLILLHGLFGSLSNWQKVESEFSAHRKVLVPELPVYDRSLRSSKLDKLVTFLEQYIERQDLDKVVLVGNSLGGHLAQLYTLRHPGKVKKLVLVGSSGLYENSFGGTFPRVKDFSYIRERVAYTFFKKEHATDVLVQKVFQTLQIPAKASSIITLARAAQTENMAEYLSHIKIPVLLLWGVQDEITPIEVAHHFHRLLPNATLRLINECGHVPMVEQPEQFNQYLRVFLEG